jgi:sugar lactone lactonase YvrE
VALAACAGARGTNLVPAAASDAAFAQGAAATTGTLSVVVRVPIPAARARYVSPSTKSLRLTITGGKHPLHQTIELSPGSRGCTKSASATTCDARIALTPGAYHATIDTYDKASARGTLLSQGVDLPLSIRAGKTTALKLALNGVPHSFAISADARGITGSASTGFTLYGTAPLAFTVAAFDADGNAIVGAGSPLYGASIASGSGWKATSPTKAAPNVFDVTPSGNTGDGATVRVTGTFADDTCKQKGAVCSIEFNATSDIQHLLVLSANGVAEYTTPVTSASTPVGTIAFSSDPVQMAMDAAGNVYVANCVATCSAGPSAPDSVAVYEPIASGGGLTATIASGVSDPLSVAASANQLFVGNDNGSVSIYTAPYSNASVPSATISTNLGAVEALALDASGNLFVASCGTSCADTPPDAIYEYAPPYTGSPIATITAGAADPRAFAFAPSGALFVSNGAGTGTNAGPYTITGYSPPFTSYDGGGTPATIATTGLAYGLAFDGDGNLFVANCGAGCQVSGVASDQLLEFAPPYTGTPTVIDTSTTDGILLRPEAVAVDAFGNLLSANTYDENVTFYAPPYTGGPAGHVATAAGPTQFILTK